MQMHLELYNIDSYTLDTELKNNIIRNRFLSNIFKEMRSPIKSIIYATDLMSSINDITDEEKETLLMIRESSQLIDYAVTDAASLHKDDDYAIHIQKDKIYIKDLIKTITLAFHAERIEKNITFTVTITNEVPDCVQGDYTRITYVLANLISNALKFSTENKSIIIEVSADKSDVSLTSLQNGVRRVSFSVRDEGVGMPYDKLQDVFSNRRMVDGQGTGLIISNNIVTSHGGLMTCESAEGQGSNFTFEIPFLVVPKSITTTTSSIGAISAFGMIVAPPPLPSPKFINALRMTSSTTAMNTYTNTNTTITRAGAEMRARPVKSHHRKPTSRNGFISQSQYISSSSASVSSSNAVTMSMTMATQQPEMEDLSADLHPNFNIILALLLKSKQCVCDVSKDGRAAVQVIQQDLSRYDVIMVDTLTANSMNGATFIRSARSYGFKNLIVGMKNSYLDSDTLLYDSGVDLIINKPITITAVNLLVQHLHNEGSASMDNKILRFQSGSLRWTS
eukprot:gene1306-2520_t